MGHIRAIHQIAPTFAYGDAIGNQMSYIREFLRRRGIESQIYVQSLDPRLADPGRLYTEYQSHPDNVLIYHYSTGSSLTDFVLRLPDQIVLYYHNVTPSEFFEKYDPAYAAMLDHGRQEVALFRNQPLAWAGSEYNRQDLLNIGFHNVIVVPYFLDFDALLAAAETPEGHETTAHYTDGWVNVLFVGRLAPNKRQDDLIRAFTYYHRLINRRSRLILVGSDANLPAYRFELEMLAERLAPGCVHMPGTVSLQALSGYYRAATVFVSMSEHEGFGIPLLEAMAFDTPVIAFAAAAVPETLGCAGVLVKHKRYDVIGELIALLAEDEILRRHIIRMQRQRLVEIRAGYSESLERALRSLGWSDGT